MKKTIWILSGVIILLLGVIYSLGSNKDANEVDQMLEPEVDNSEITIISPAKNDEYCVGDNIPITFTTPKNVEVVKINYLGVSSSADTLGEFRTNEATEDEPFTTTTINWNNQIDWSGKQVRTSVIARITVLGKDKDFQNSRVAYSATTDLFSLIDCER